VKKKKKELLKSCYNTVRSKFISEAIKSTKKTIRQNICTTFSRVWWGLTKVTHSGNESLLRIFKPGQFFGHRSLFSEEPYHASAKCLEPTLILAVRREKVTETFDAHPRAYYFLSRALAKELRRAENRSVLVSEAHITERVAAALLLFKKLYPEHLWTRSEIANYCATRTPTVIKILSELEKQGAIIQQRRHIEIKDESVLLSHLGEGLDSLQ
jgi:CRP-like cAMP-binding protein